MKFALVSHVLPPGGSGQAMVIFRLLRDLPAEQYCLISQQSHIPEAGCRDYFGRLPGKYFHLPVEYPVAEDMPRWRRRANILLGLGIGGFSRANRIEEILKAENCEAVVACTGGDMLNLPAGFIASRRLNLPFYVYIFDDYAHQLPKLQILAKRLEPVMVKRAAAVITPNEFMQDKLRERYGVESVIIRNPCDVSQYDTPAVTGSNNGDGNFTIVYTGAVYSAHFDAFRQLIAALRIMNRPEVKLHIYTLDPIHILKEEGIDGPFVIFKEYQELGAIPSIQQQADILFLPLAFNSPFPELIRTSAPGKMGELLAARRPILVSAPADSFVSWYFRRHECGLVVDERDPAKLAEAIEQLIRDQELRQRLTARAWERAESDFSLVKARSKFTELLKVNIRK